MAFRHVTEGLVEKAAAESGSLKDLVGWVVEHINIGRT